MDSLVKPYDALVGGDPAASLKWYESKRRSLLNKPARLHDWARLLCSLGRRAEADELLGHLAGIEDYAMFAAGQRLVAALERGLSPAQALAATPLGAAERHRAAIAGAMAARDLARRPQPARHIAICGVSFCGSTLMEVLLGALPGVASIGESLWLTHDWAAQGTAPRDYSAPRNPASPPCNRCGHDCRRLTADFRTALGLNPVDWYFRIAEQLGAGTLVSADKSLMRIVTFEPLGRLQALVVFKSPKQAWASNYAKPYRSLAPDACWRAMEGYMKVWREVYADLTFRYRPHGGSLFLDFDRFTRGPEAGLLSLARALGLEYEAAALIRPRPGHSLGGNGGTRELVSRPTRRGVVRRLPEPAIPAAHAAWIDSQEDLTELHREMRRRSAEQLGV